MRRPNKLLPCLRADPRCSSACTDSARAFVARSGADLPYTAFIIQAYGVVLTPFPAADQEQGNLSRALGSVVGTACLRAETRVGPQLTSHVFGLLKARSIEGLSEEDRWLSSDEGTEWVIKAVDRIYDVARGEEYSAKL